MVLNFVRTESENLSNMAYSDPEQFLRGAFFAWEFNGEQNFGNIISIQNSGDDEVDELLDVANSNYCSSLCNSSIIMASTHCVPYIIYNMMIHEDE